MIINQIGQIFCSLDMGILPPLPTNPARSRREGDNGLFSSISSSFRPIVGLSGAAVKSFHCDSVEGAIRRTRKLVAHSSERRRRKQKGRRERERMDCSSVRSPFIVSRSTCDIDFGGTNIVFGHCVSRASRLRTPRFPQVH